MNRALATILRGSLVLLVLLVLAGATARPALATVKKDRKPSFPSVEEAQAITRTQIPIRYPRVTTGFNFAISSIDQARLEASIDGALETIGAPGNTSLPATDTGLGLMLGIRLSYRLGLAAETVYSIGGDDLTADYYAGLATVVLTSPRLRWCSLGVGAGIGNQRITTHQTYNILLSDGGTLEGITYESAWQRVVPLEVVLELPNLRYSHYAFVTTVRKVLGEVQSGTFYTGMGTTVQVPFEVDFDGWIVTVGLAVGL